MFSSGGLFASQVAIAQETSHSDENVQRITITGSSLKRIDSEGALPVSTLSHAEIERSGATTVEQLTANLPVLSSAGATSSAQSMAQSTMGRANISLRGLGSERTLVLMNGKRLPSSGTSAPDVNAIPVSALDRVEILRDGASALYGSDAMAGVVNFIMRDDYRGFEANAYTGTPTRSGGGESHRAGFLAGWGDYVREGYNFTLSFDYTQERSIWSSNRNFANQAWDASPAGLWNYGAINSGGLYSWAPNTSYANQFSSTVGGMRGMRSFANPLSPDNCAQAGSSYNWMSKTCRYDPTSDSALTPESERFNLFSTFKRRLSGGGEVYSQFLFNHARIEVVKQSSAYTPAALADDARLDAANKTILLKASNYWYQNTPGLSNILGQYAGNDLAVNLRLFDGGNRIRTDYVDTLHLNTGLRDSWQEWNYDISAFLNWNRAREETKGGFQQQSQLISALNSADFQDGKLSNGEFNPFTQYQDSMVAAAIRASNYYGHVYSLISRNVGLETQASRELSELPGGPLQLAIGAMVNQEHIRLDASEVAQSGDLSGYAANYVPFAHARNHIGIFSELVAPFSRQLEATTSLRADQYQAVGTTVNPKFSLRLRPVNELILRGSLGTGFRAPRLSELYAGPKTSLTGIMIDPYSGNSGQYPVTSGGNPDLKPEKSRQGSLGFVFEPVHDFSISADYFRIRIQDPILSFSPAYIVAQAAAGNPYFTSMVTTANGQALLGINANSSNGGREEVSGIDVDLRWKIARLENNTLSANLSGTYIRQFDFSQPGNETQASVGRTVDAYNKPLAAISGGGLILKWRHALTLALRNPDWGISLTQNFQSSYEDAWSAYDAASASGDVPNEKPTHKVGAFSTYDLNFQYTGIKNLRVNFGVKNLFDKNPPAVVGIGLYGQYGFDPSYYDARARFAYLSLNLKFN